MADCGCDCQDCFYRDDEHGPCKYGCNGSIDNDAPNRSVMTDELAYRWAEYAEFLADKITGIGREHDQS